MNLMRRSLHAKTALWLTLILALSAFLMHPAGSQGAEATPLISEEEALETLLPEDGDVKGLKALSDAEFYMAENLFDYMDGQAEAYLAYGFRMLIMKEYGTEDGSPPATVEIYLMESPLHAFGIFAAERSPGDRVMKIGVQGYMGDGVLGFWKGPYYVKIISLDMFTAEIEMFEKIGKAISDKVEGTFSEPEIFSAFPEGNRVKMSERFIPRNFLGQSFLKNAYRADYEEGVRNYQVFLLRENSTEEANAIFQKYQAFLQSQDEQISLMTKEGLHIAFSKGKEAAKTLFQYGSFFGGVLNQEDSSQAVSIIEDVVRRLKH